ncbi:MAG: hypothetical protein H6565_11885 [Lewinellaceae bacterium]|nr:hypothetical protein [Lewinellaceae bacterium]
MNHLQTFQLPSQPAAVFHTEERRSSVSALIMSALGADSVPPGLRSQLDRMAGVRYLANLKPLEPEAFVSLARPFQYLAITRRAVRRLDGGMIDALPRLKGLSVYSTGLEWIDLDRLQRRGIPVLGLPDYCTNAVAETALGLILMTAHKLHLRYLKSLHAIPESVSLCGFELQHCRIGIIGYGRIGRLLAKKVRPLCAEVLIADEDTNRYGPPEPGIEVTDIKTLLSDCDFVVVCASQEFAEKALIEQRDYALLSPRSVVVNVARTSLLDHDLLVKMVKKQQIRAYLYDDLMRDDDRPNEREYGKIVPTGHTAWYTEEAMASGTNTWINNLITLCKGK